MPLHMPLQRLMILAVAGILAIAGPALATPMSDPGPVGGVPSFSDDVPGANYSVPTVGERIEFSGFIGFRATSDLQQLADSGIQPMQETAAVPVPGSLALIGIGLLGVSAYRRYAAR